MGQIIAIPVNIPFYDGARDTLVDRSGRWRAAAKFAYLPFSNQSLATLCRHLAFNGYEREKAQKIAF